MHRALIGPLGIRPASCARQRATRHCLGGAIRTTVVGVRLLDRCVEKKALDEVLDSVHAGMSGSLVLRGEPGVGKSALLGYAVERAEDLQIVRTVAVESENTLGFAAVHQLLVPLMPAMDGCPSRSGGDRRGVRTGARTAADPFLVGLAVLTLLADAAEVRPVLCVMDDAQWLDKESADALSFVARRLRPTGRDAVRHPGDDGTGPRLHAVPGLRIAGLPHRTRTSSSRCRSAGRSTPRSRSASSPRPAGTLSLSSKRPAS